jgi:hypothetical protein
MDKRNKAKILKKRMYHICLGIAKVLVSNKINEEKLSLAHAAAHTTSHHEK